MTWYRSGGGGIPSVLKEDMNAVLNKKFSTETVYPPETWANSVNLLGKLPEATKSGTIVHFTDGADGVPMKNLVCKIPANLEGISHLEVSHTGINILDGEFETGWIYNDGSIGFVSGRIVTKNFSPCKGSTSYRFSFGDSWRVAWYDSNYNFISLDGTYPSDRVLSSPANAKFVKASLPVPTTTFACINYPSSETGHDEYMGVSQFVQLGQTVYGGSADIVTGEGESLCDKYNVTGQETGDFLAGTNNNGNRIGLSGFGLVQKPLYTGGVSNIGENKACLNSATWTIGSWCIYTDNKLYFVVPNEYTTFSEALQYLVENNATFVFPLATTTSFIFTGQEINSLYGVNNIWNDTGDTSVTYRRDIELALAGNGNAPLMMMASRPTTVPDPEEISEEEPEENPEEI